MGDSDNLERDDDPRALQLQAVLDHAPDAFVSMARDGRIIEWNLQAQRLFGWSREEAIGCTVAELIVSPQARADHERGLARYLQTGEARVLNRPIELHALSKEGRLIAVELTIAAVERGEDVTFNAFIRDITARKGADEALAMSERHLADALALGGLGMWEFDLDADHVTWSDELCRIVGFARGESPTTLDGFMALVHEEDRARIGQSVEHSRDAGVSETEYRLVRPDGDIRWVHGHRRATYDADGRPTGMSGTLRDITGRVSAERALRDAEERFRRSFDEAPIGMALVSLEGRWTRVNDALCEILGYPESELMALRFQDITHPHDLDADEELVRQMLAAERATYDMDKRYLHADGQIVWAKLSVSLARDAAGEPMYFIAQIQDITAERRRRRELEEQGAALADAQAIAQIGSWSWDPEPDVAEWSAEMYRIFGREPADGPATAEDLFAYLHPDDRDRIAAGYAAAFGAGASFELEYRIVTRDGEVRWLHGLGRREAAGRYVGTVQDVTERRGIERSLTDAEELLALAFDQSPLGMTLSTPDRGVLRINQAFADMLGYSVDALIANQHPTRFTHPDDHAVDQDHVSALLAGDDRAGQWDKRYIHAHGHSVWARVSVSVLRHGDGSPRHLVSQIEDITERRQREAEEHALRDVAELVAAGAAPAIVFGAIAGQVRHLFEATASAVMRFDAAANTGTMLGAAASDGASLVGMTCDLDSSTASAAVFRTGRPARVDVLALTDADPMRGAVARSALTASVAAPIRVGGEVWGAVGAAFAGQQIAVGAELRLERFAHLASLAIANLQTLEMLEHRAATDPLTQIANYRTFHDRLREEVERARRYGRDLSIVLLDLDHFKAINDMHGHQAGDRILKEVAERLNAETRDGELVARVGGEEFAWLIPEADQHGAYAAAERVRRAIEATPFLDAGTITLSAGVCSTEHAHDAQELVLYADHALYRAKDHGRNNTFLFTHQTPAIDTLLH